MIEEPTERADRIAAEVRRWYERNRETWWQRSRFNPRGRRWETSADEFMLGLIDTVFTASEPLPPPSKDP
jgi:hypothetical protein